MIVLVEKYKAHYSVYLWGMTLILSSLPTSVRDREIGNQAQATMNNMSVLGVRGGNQ